MHSFSAKQTIVFFSLLFSHFSLHPLMMIFLFYVKMHFFYAKSNILCKWSNILRNFYVTMFTPEHSLLRRSIPLRPPGPPPHPARHPTRPATRPGPPPHPARHPTLRATPPKLTITSHATFVRQNMITSSARQQTCFKR